MVIGGEFFYDDRWNTTNRSVLPKDMLFLNGGKACLIVISRFLINHGINRVLLPSYLCPTIVSTLERCGLHCDYYQVLPDFSIDLEDLDRKAIHHQVVYFINYFGFSGQTQWQKPPRCLKKWSFYDAITRCRFTVLDLFPGRPVHCHCTDRNCAWWCNR